MSKTNKYWLSRIKMPLEIIIILFNILLAIWFVYSLRSGFISQKPGSVITNIQSLDKTDLEIEKLRQEIRQLDIENSNLTSPWQTVSSIAAVITVIVALVGVFVTIWKQFLERQRDREQREAESRRRLDEKFSSIITDIGSENSSLKVSAAVSLITYLRNEYAEFHEQVYLVLLANLKIIQELQLNRLLIQCFERAIRIMLKTKHDINEELFLDLTSTNLYYIDLSGLNLSNVDIAFADLELADLKSTNLFRVKGYDVNLEKAKLTGAYLNEARLYKASLENAHLHGANLVSSNLKKSNLRGAQFFEAKLQAAHLENADLSGARFEKADLNDTYFYGAEIPDETLKSIRKAYHWEKAHFDVETRKRLDEIIVNPSS